MSKTADGARRTIRQIVAELYDEMAEGDTFNVKEVEDEAVARAAAAGVEDDLLRAAVIDAVKDRDREAHDKLQLTFAGWGYGQTLNLGEGERIGARQARLEHVIADDELFDVNWRAQQERKVWRDQRTRELLPYLAKGMTVGEAINAWTHDHPDP